MNYAPNQSQCYLQIPVEELQVNTLHLLDLMGSAEYHRQTDAIRAREIASPSRTPTLPGPACMGLPRIRDEDDDT